MPLKFWNDKKDKKFKEAYFNRLIIHGITEILLKLKKLEDLSFMEDQIPH